MRGMRTKVSVVLLTSVFASQFVGEVAWAGGGDTTNTVVAAPTESNVVAAPTESAVLQTGSNVSTNAATLSTSPISLQQTGINNFANVGTTTIPNCGGVCVYTNVKSISGNGGGLSSSQTEISAGFVWQISSPDQTNVETQRHLADAQIGKGEDEVRFTWMKELTAAIRAGNIADANGIAILLAPKLGKTPQQLLNEVTRMKL